MKMIKMYDKKNRTWTFEVEVSEQELSEILHFRTEILPLVEQGTDDLFSVILLGECAKRLYQKRANDEN